MASYPTINTCRFCETMLRDGEGVKYGVRHYAHFACYLEADKPLEALHNWQILRFPFRLLKERGLLEEVKRLTDNPNRARWRARRVVARYEQGAV